MRRQERIEQYHSVSEGFTIECSKTNYNKILSERLLVDLVSIRSTVLLAEFRVWIVIWPPDWSPTAVTAVQHANTTKKTRYKIFQFILPCRNRCQTPRITLMGIIYTFSSDNKRNSIIRDPWLGLYSLGILKNLLFSFCYLILCDKSKGHWRTIY